jgi:hypothetical protein
MIQPRLIEDGAELEAEWEGSSRLRSSTWKSSSQRLKSEIARWTYTYVGLKRRMSVLGDVVVADKQNTMLSKMDLRWY